MPPWADGDTRGTSTSAAARVAASCGGSSGSDGSRVPVIACLGLARPPRRQRLLPRLGRGDVAEGGAVVGGEAGPLAAQLCVDREGLLEQLAIVGGVATVERGRRAVVHGHHGRV